MFPRAAPRPRPRAGWLIAAALPMAAFATECFPARAVAASPWGEAEVVGEEAEAEGGGAVAHGEVVDGAHQLFH